VFAVILSIYRSLSDITLTDYFSYSSFLCSAIFTTALTLSSAGHYRHLPLHHHSLICLLSSSFSHLPSLTCLLSSHFSHLTSLISLLSSFFSHLPSLTFLLSPSFSHLTSLIYLPLPLSPFRHHSFLLLPSFFSSFFSLPFLFLFPFSLILHFYIFLLQSGTAENPAKTFSWDS
jgi:hypothetical protein